MAATAPRGSFVWHELMTVDPDAAIPFYRRVIGWDVTRWEYDPKYRMWTAKGVPTGGLMQLPEDARKGGAPPHWLAYVAVPDVDATVRLAVGKGARPHLEGMDIPNVGRIAVLADPQGATFAVHTPTMPAGGDDTFQVGDFSWHELAAADWKAAWEFYRALFGWEHDSSFDMGPMGTYFMFRRAGGPRSLGGMYDKPAEMPAPPHWLPYVNVSSADRAAELAARHGGRVLNGPMEVPGGDRVAQLMDPQGAAFAVHSLAPKAAAKPARPAAKRKAAPKPARAKRAAPKRAARKTAATRRVAKQAAKKTAAKKAAKRTAAKRRPRARKRAKKR